MRIISLNSQQCNLCCQVCTISSGYRYKKTTMRLSKGNISPLECLNLFIFPSAVAVSKFRYIKMCTIQISHKSIGCTF